LGDVMPGKDDASTRRGSALIPPRFADALDQHLVFNFAGVEVWPLVLGIFGRPGDGKSFQARTHLERRGVLPVSINAADLESDRAGTPGKLVLETYINAGHRIEEGTPAALIVDDFDTTVGEWEHSTTTVNHQQVLAQLMHLADSPTDAAGKKLRRVPVVITGNDLSKVYPPLRRPGRMRAFPWLPSDDERNDIVASILADVLPAHEVPALVAELDGAPSAFFSDLLVEIVAAAAVEQVHALADNLTDLIQPGSRRRDELLKHITTSQPTANQIRKLARRLWDERALATQSHLGI
jgi:ATP-dependent 26S proteasome regulatory subunit